MTKFREEGACFTIVDQNEHIYGLLIKVVVSRDPGGAIKIDESEEEEVDKLTMTSLLKLLDEREFHRSI